MKKKFIYLSLSILLCCLTVVGCKTTTKRDDDTQKENSPNTQATDYSQAEHWLSLPTELDKNVDVFYLYPTVWAKENESDPIICDIDNPVMLQQSQIAYEKQATAFLDTGNIYAPYYRQLDASSALNMSLEEQTALIKGIPLTDSIAAFEYYIEHYNNGRPFILASHSQGSNIMIYLLSDYMKDHPDVYARMISAYVIGYSVTDDYLIENPHLKFAQGAEDTGVIISYNTQAPTIEGDNPVVIPNAKVINPISWTTNETLAPASESLGSLEINIDGSIALNSDGSPYVATNFADAQIDKEKGVLICSTVDVNTYAPGNDVFGKGIFHTYDYPFYYFDLKANAELRTNNYLKNHN